MFSGAARLRDAGAASLHAAPDLRPLLPRPIPFACTLPERVSTAQPSVAAAPSTSPSAPNHQKADHAAYFISQNMRLMRSRRQAIAAHMATCVR